MTDLSVLPLLSTSLSILLMILTSASVSTNILIEKKFLKRTQSKADKRVFYISLLVKGKKIFDLHAEHVERTAREWFSKMTEEEQEGMLQLWEKTFS